jgi:putative Mg2+ transporter-C (MgtC) family protein
MSLPSTFTASPLRWRSDGSPVGHGNRPDKVNELEQIGPKGPIKAARKKMAFNFSEEPWNLIISILAAAVFGAVLGLERDIHGRGAGFRTHLLVCAGSALFTILSKHISTSGVVTPSGFATVTDPGRIAAQIVTGIGFLGAGVIIREGFTVRGLTTAACLWITAAIGMATGAGLYTIAVLTTLLALFSLLLLRRLERFYRRDSYRDLEVKVPNEVDIQKVIDTVKGIGIMIISFGLERDYENQTTTARMSLRLFHRGSADKLSHLLIEKLEQTHLPIKSIKWFRP